MNQLPASILPQDCYAHMFDGCKELRNAPKILATSLSADDNNALKSMFEGCEKLNYVEVSLPDPKSAATDILKDVGAHGTIKTASGLYSSKWESKMPDDWKITPPPSEGFLTLTATSAVTITSDFDEYALPEYTDDSITWQPLPATLTLALGDIIQLRAQCKYAPGLNSLIIDGSATLSGSLMSMYNYSPSATTITESYCFKGLFAESGNLTVNSILSATSISYGCYAELFRQCESVSYNGNLSASNEYSFQSMFSGSTVEFLGSITAPLLSHTCDSMFAGADVTTPPVPAWLSISAYSCYKMFCGSSVDSMDALPDIVLAPHCYESMYENCTSLTTIPDDALPSTSLAESCYERMFYNCTNLSV